jgi:hypothetical protein
MTPTKKKISLEEFFAAPKERPELVTDWNREELVKKSPEKLKKAEAENLQRNLSKQGEVVVEQKGKDSKVDYAEAPIEVDGYGMDRAVSAPVAQNPVQPPAAPTAPSEQAPAAKTPIKDLIPKEEDFKLPARDTSFPWDRALIGATPLLVGLLTGNQLEGTKTSADYYTKTESDLYKREWDLNDKIAAMKAKRDPAAEGKHGSKRWVAQTIALTDGTNVKASFDSYTGKYHMPDGSEIPSSFIRAGFSVNPEEFTSRLHQRSDVKRADADYLSQNTRLDPTTGELGVVRNGNITPVQGQRTGAFNVKNESDMKNAVKEITSSSAYKDATQSLSLAPQVQSLLTAAERSNDPNSIAGSSVVLTMIRQAQRVGISSDKDAAAMGGTQQWAESIERLTEKLLGSGKPLTDRDIQDLREISNIYTKRAKDLLTSYYGQKKQSLASRHNIAPELIDEQIGPEVMPYLSGAETQIRAKNAPEKVTYKGKEYFAPDREQRLAIEIDGKLFWTNSKWEDVVKEHPKAKRLN